MREKARALRDAREERRLKKAETLLDRAWQENCEPLRTLMSRREHEKIDQDRLAQRAQLEAIAQQEQAAEAYFAREWDMDRLSKHARETAEMMKKRKMSAHNAACLDAQMVLLDQVQADAAKIKEEETALRFEQVAMVEEQERREAEIERTKKAQLRSLFDEDVQQKRQQATQSVEEDIASDLRLIAQLEEEKATADVVARQNKQLLAKQAKMYAAYVQETRAQEEAHEAACDSFLASEAKKENEKRRLKQQEKKHRRAVMMLDVVQTLQDQMQYKWNTIMQAQMEKMNEAKQIAAGIADLNRQMEAKAAAAEAENAQHTSDLQQQIRDARSLKQQEKDDERRLVQALAGQRQKEETKITDAIHQFQISGIKIGK
jgi:hypothetical protein